MSTQYSFSQQVNDAYQLQTYLTGAIGSISYINYSPDTQGVIVYTTASLTSGQASSLTAAMSAYPNPAVVPVVTSSFSLAFNTLSGSALSIGGPYASITGSLAVGTDVLANRNIAAVGTVSGTALNVTGQYASVSGFLAVGTDLQVNRNIATVATITGTALNVTGQYASMSGFVTVGTDLQVNRNIAAVATITGTALNLTGQYASISGFVTVGTDLQVNRNIAAVATITGTALNLTGQYASMSGFLTVGTDLQVNRNIAAVATITGSALNVTGQYASISGFLTVGTDLQVNRNISAVATITGSALNVAGQYASISGFVTVGTDLQVNRNISAVATITGLALNVTGQYASMSGFLTVGTDLQVKRNLVTAGTITGTALVVTGQYSSLSGFLTVGTDMQVNRNLAAAGTITGTALVISGGYASVSGFLTVGTDLQVNRNLAVSGTITGTALTITGGYASVSGSVGIGTNLVVGGSGTIAQTLNTGPLTVNQSTVQNTLTIDCRSSQTLPGTMIFANTAGTGDLRITSDGGDIQWQGGGGRALQMGAYHGITLLGGRVSNGVISQVNGSGSLYNTAIQNTNDSIALIAQGLVGQVSDLQRWQDASGNIFARLSSAGQVLAPGFTGSNLTLIAQTVSALPVSPAATLYIDPADNVMKTVNSTGRVTTYSPETTKGDITVYNGTTQVRLPVGTNESSLIADSTQTVGMRWSPTFGSEFQNLIDSTSVQTSGTKFLTKPSLTLTTTSLVGGNYMVGVRYNYKVSNYIFNVEITVLMDGNVWHDNVTTSLSSKSSIVVSDWTVLNLSAGVHTMTLQYRVVDSGVNVTVPSSSFYIYRAEQI